MPRGQDNLVPSIETKIEDPQQQTKSCRRQKRTFKQANIIETPTKILEPKPIKEMVKEILKLLEIVSKMVPNSISEPSKENWVKSLWEEVWKANEVRDSKGKAPIAKKDLDKKEAHVDMVTRYADTQFSSLDKSKASSMKELPSFVKPERIDKEVLKLPSQYHPSPIVMVDTTNTIVYSYQGYLDIGRNSKSQAGIVAGSNHMLG